MELEINLNIGPQDTSKKRILFVITQSEMGGAQRFLYTIISSLDKNAFDMALAVGSDGTEELAKRVEAIGIPVYIIKSLKRAPNIRHDIITIFQIRKIIKDFKPDDLFLNSSKTGFIGSLASVFPKRIKGLKVIYRIGGWAFNDPWSSWKKNLWISLERISARWKDVIIVNNKYDSEQAKRLKIKPREKTVLIHNGIDPYKIELLPREEARLKLFEKIAKTSGKIFQINNLVGTIANFYPTKGINYLIDAAEKFKNNKNLAFVVIGDGEERKLYERRIKEKQLENKFYLIGQIEDAHKYLLAFDIFVLPSVKEGFPWALIEAMSAKLPVIATSVGAVPEIIEDGKNGFIVQSENSIQLYDKIKLLTDNDRLRQEMGIRAHQTILFKFSLNKMTRSIEAIL